MAIATSGRERIHRTPDSTDEALRELVFKLLCVFWFTLPWEGVLRFGGTATIAKVAGGIVAIAAAGSLLKSGRRVAANDYIVVTLVFAGWVALSVFWTSTPDDSRQRVITMAQLVIMVLITWEFAHTRRRVTVLMSAWVAGCIVIAAIVILAWVRGQNENRYTAPGTHPGDLAFSLLIGIPMAWYLSMRAVRPALVLAYRLFVPFVLLAVVLSASRSALVAGGIPLMIIPLTLPRLSPRVKMALGAALALSVAAGLVLATAAAGPIQRLGTTSSEISTGTLDHRTQLWAIGLRLLGHHPWIGLGTGGAKTAVGTQFVADRGLHNTFLSIAVELGLVGLALFVLILVSASYRTLTTLPWLESRFAVVLVATFVVSLVPRHDDYVKSTYAILTLIALMGSVFAVRSRSAGSLPADADLDNALLGDAAPPWRRHL